MFERLHFAALRFRAMTLLLLHPPADEKVAGMLLIPRSAGTFMYLGLLCPKERRFVYLVPNALEMLRSSEVSTMSLFGAKHFGLNLWLSESLLTCRRSSPTKLLW